MEIACLTAAIKKTIEENKHLADGDNCTLRHLQEVIGHEIYDGYRE